MRASSVRAWLLGMVLLAVLLAAFFALGLYVGEQGLTTPTVPPWPEPKAGAALLPLGEFVRSMYCLPYGVVDV